MSCFRLLKYLLGNIMSGRVIITGTNIIFKQGIINSRSNTLQWTEENSYNHAIRRFILLMFQLLK